MPHSAIQARPLCVDLDDTLSRTDLLVRAVFALLKRDPLNVFLLQLWLLRGKAVLKQANAHRVDLDVTLLPYNQPLLDWITEMIAPCAKRRHISFPMRSPRCAARRQKRSKAAATD